MAFDDPIVWILIIVVLIAIPIYLLSLLVRFLWKANRFMDEYNAGKKRNSTTNNNNNANDSEPRKETQQP